MTTAGGLLMSCDSEQQVRPAICRAAICRCVPVSVDICIDHVPTNGAQGKAHDALECCDPTYSEKGPSQAPDV